jgi:hypothetical protein
MRNATPGPSGIARLSPVPDPDPNPDPVPDPNPDPTPDPDNDPNPDDDATDDEDDQQSILQAILSRRGDESGKVREPDTFDGSDPKKLKSFLVLCQLTYNDRPRAFRSDRKKINYVISFLRGTALEWFEPAIIDTTS